MKKRKGFFNRILLAMAKTVIKRDVNSTGTYLFYQQELPKGTEKFRDKFKDKK